MVRDKRTSGGPGSALLTAAAVAAMVLLSVLQLTYSVFPDASGGGKRGIAYGYGEASSLVVGGGSSPAGTASSTGGTTGGTSGGGGTTGGTTLASSQSSQSSSRRIGPPSTCGNALLDAGEECDNGRYNGLSPECDRQCRSKFCGDEVVSRETGEECEPDPANEPACGGKACTVPSCDEDGICTGGCRWEFRPACKASAASKSSRSRSSSSVVNPLPEASSISSSVPGAASSVPPAASSIPPEEDPVDEPIDGVASSEPIDAHPLCGDGTVQSDIEECDDGNRDGGDGCDAACFAEPVCGNGYLDPEEQCDDGEWNADAEPGRCRTSCLFPSCGDGVLDAGEACDDGNAILGDGCTPTCVRATCGNGELELGEECDMGALNNDIRPDSCSTLCLLPRCGDGVVDPAFGEACDEGLSNAVAADRCRPDCRSPRCGDGVTDAGEACDDGNARPGDGCSERCEREAPCPGGPGCLLHGAAGDDGPDRPLLYLLALLLIGTAAEYAMRWAASGFRRRRRRRGPCC